MKIKFINILGVILLLLTILFINGCTDSTNTSNTSNTSNANIVDNQNDFKKLVERFRVENLPPDATSDYILSLKYLLDKSDTEIDTIVKNSFPNVTISGNESILLDGDSGSSYIPGYVRFISRIKFDGEPAVGFRSIHGSLAKDLMELIQKDNFQLLNTKETPQGTYIYGKDGYGLMFKNNSYHNMWEFIIFKINPAKNNGKNTKASSLQKKIEQPPLKLLKALVTFNAIDNPEARVIVKNVSKKTVDAYDLGIYCFDRYGDPVNHYLYDTNRFGALSQNTIKPGQSFGSNSYWTLYGHENTAKIKVVLEKVHFTDGTTWIPAEGQEVFVEGVSKK